LWRRHALALCNTCANHWLSALIEKYCLLIGTDIHLNAWDTGMSEVVGKGAYVEMN
jgi:hypothetical protein